MPAIQFAFRRLCDRPYSVVLLVPALLILCILGFSGRCLAQYATAVLNGTVRDASGAVVAGADANVENRDTGLRRSTASNESGVFSFTEIPPGVYSLTITKRGFQTVRREGMTLAVNQTAVYDFTLQVGATQQTIVVEAASENIEPSSASLGTVVGTQSVDDLPLNGRNFTQLLTLTPGASPVNVSQSSSGWRTNAIGSFTFPSINGQPNRSNTWLLDGVSNTEAITGSNTVTPIVDDIQEFRVVSHTDQAQFGGATGGVVNVISKSGTNNFRGTLWEFLRNSDLDARNPFFLKVNPLRQNQFGANFGGPVLLPHYDGRNKTFFFGSYEGFRQSQASQTLYVVPTQQELSGDLSALGVQIYNPFTTRPDPNHPGQLLRDPFPNNQIPGSVLDANMVKYAESVYPQPVQTGVAGYNGVDLTPSTHNGNTYNIRADEYVNEQNQIWFHYEHQTSPTSSSGGFIGLRSETGYSAYNLGVSWAHTFGPSAVLTVSFGRNIGEVDPTTVFVGGSVTSILQQTNFSPAFTCGFKHSFRSCMLPGMTISGFVGGGEDNGAPNVNSDVNEFKLDFSKVIGRHTLFTGFNLDTNNQGAAASADPGIGFTAFQTSNLEISQGGSPLASFLMGVPDNATRQDVLNSEHGGWVNGGYFQDQWKVTDRFTINLGLRYDVTLVPVIGEIGIGDYYGATDFDNGTYIIQNQPPACSSTQFAPCIPGGTLPAHVVVSSNGKLYQNDYRDFQPRVSLAYRLTNNSALRAGYGRVYDNWAAVDQSAQNIQSWPSVASNLVQNLNTAYPTVPAENPFLGFSGAVPAPTPFNQLGWNGQPQFRAPYSDQWNFGIQQQLSSTSVFTLNYVGSHSGRTDIAAEANTAITPGPGNPSDRSPYPYITPSYYDKPIGRASYEAFQFSLKGNSTSKRLTYLVSYTWSKTIDIGSDGWYCSEGCSIENPYDLNSNKSVAGYDLPQMFTASWVYRIPIGKGHFSTGNRVADYVLGNWDLNGIARLTSGMPYTIDVCGDIANTGNGGCYERPNLVGNPNLSNPSPAMWFNVNAFQIPAPYTFGNLGRNALRADWFKDLDLSLFRQFPISETRRFEFRADAFNSTNTPTWGVPNSTLNANNFGVVTSTRSTERQLQLALKFYF